MERCPECVQNRPGVYSDLYKAVAKKNNDVIDAILECHKHKEKMLKYVSSEPSRFTSLLKAVVDDNYQVVEKLVKAGAQISYTAPRGINALNYDPGKDHKKMVSVIFESLSTLEQIQTFCKLGLELKLHTGVLNGALLCKLLNQDGKKYVLSRCLYIINNEELIGSKGKKKVEEFIQIQKKKIEILLKHADMTKIRLPGDVTRVIASLVFPEKS